MNTRRYIPFLLASLTLLLLVTLACAALTDSQGGEGEPIPVCTPPSCARNEIYACEGDCPGGCGTYCTMFTPAPDLLYPAVELVNISLSDHTLQISVDVPGIEGDFYGVVARENFECDLSQSDLFSEELTCTGNLWFNEGTQTLRIYRTSDDWQAFNLDFVIP